jgi:hypothetical protein
LAGSRRRSDQSVVLSGAETIQGSVWCYSENGIVVMIAERRLLENAYAAFNDRDIDAALAAMHGDVCWPNGMEGGSVHGHEAVREYWTRQWDLIDPHVEPLRFDADEAGRMVVDVRQVVRDRNGTIMVDEIVQHVYLIQEGLVRSMEIREPPA